jgi:hypothetical protein
MRVLIAMRVSAGTAAIAAACGAALPSTARGPWLTSPQTAAWFTSATVSEANDSVRRRLHRIKRLRRLNMTRRVCLQAAAMSGYVWLSSLRPRKEKQ